MTVADAIGELPPPLYFRRGLAAKDIPYHPNHWAMNPKSPKFYKDFLKSRNSTGRSFRLLEWDKPSCTVAYGHNEVHVHPSGQRRLSVYEAMLLQGFPKDYQLLGTLTDQFRQVSNAVPPPLAEALGKSIRLFLDGNPDTRLLKPESSRQLELVVY